MSWIFGVCASDNAAAKSAPLARFHDTPLHVCSRPGFYLAVGGIDETCHFRTTENTRTGGWVVVGMGLERSDFQVRILTGDDWDRKLTSTFDGTTSLLDELDGHFTAIRWDSKGIACACDQLGQRTLYYVESGEEVFFSTRLDWLAHATQRNEVDFEALGSKWLLFNQLSYDSCIKGIRRLGPSGRAFFSNGVLKKETGSVWLPVFSGGKIDDAIAVVEGFADCAFTQPRTVTLGLSGGIDSRFLLAMLTRKGTGDVRVHTFGEPEDPDVSVAAMVARSVGAEQTLFNDPIPDPDTCLAMARSYVAQTQLIEPVASAVRLRYYGRLRALGRMMIDGGFGEIARRQYLNRLARFGRFALRRGDVDALLPLMSVPRGRVFVPEVQKMLESGTRRDLQTTLESMPPLRDVGIGNFVDLLAVRTRVPNYGGPEQARLDCEVFNFMPFVQPSFLRAVFASDVRTRANARFYRRYIASRKKALTRFPLVKSGSTYRFGLPLLAVHATTFAKKKAGRYYRDGSTDAFLHTIREYVQDLAASQSVLSCPLYDSAAIRSAVQAYYSGVPGFAGTVAWWLTFEMWRSGLKR